MARLRCHLSVATTLRSLEHPVSQILLSTYLNGLLHNRIIRQRKLSKARASARDMRPIMARGAYLMD